MATNGKDLLEGLRLDGKVALVTGGSSGIGHAAALALGAAGAAVCVQGHGHMEEAEAVTESIRASGSEAIAVRADVASPADVARMVATAVDEFGGLDIAVCNAGIFEMGNLEDISDESWQRHLDVNVSGAFYTTRRAVPEMRRRGKGKLVYTGSIFGPYGVPGALPYCVSKSALHGMTKALAIELASDHINVNAVAPGNIVTPMNTGLYQYVSKAAGGAGDVEHGKQVIRERYPVGRLGSPDDVVVPILYLVSDAADFVTGQIMFVDGGYSSA
jgi:NAD(P)-dependent dehydrogenase (short-subunit alcohol dehydrogenase family)